MNLSAHFTLEELIASDTARKHGIDNTPDEKVLKNLKRLAPVLEQIRYLLGGKSVTISSGFRCQALNRKIGGADNSAHIIGCAADIKLNYLTLHNAAQMIVNSGLDFDQLILEPTWIHVAIADEGKKSRRQVLTTKTGKAPYLQGLVK